MLLSALQTLVSLGIQQMQVHSILETGLLFPSVSFLIFSAKDEYTESKILIEVNPQRPIAGLVVSTLLMLPRKSQIDKTT